MVHCNMQPPSSAILCLQFDYVFISTSSSQTGLNIKMTSFQCFTKNSSISLPLPLSNFTKASSIGTSTCTMSFLPSCSSLSLILMIFLQDPLIQFWH
jgi:hypothetical protein